MKKFIFLIIIVALSTLWLYLLHFFAPNLNSGEGVKKELKFPSSLEELQKVAGLLKLYSLNHWWYVFLIFGSAYIYKQAFCIPGSIFLNLLAGALYGKLGGLFFACLFTSMGATMCYILSLTFAKELVLTYFRDRFSNFQKKVKENEDNLLPFMLFIRLVPIAPGWVINVVAPLVDVPVPIFILSTFFGLVPYNFIGVSAGGMLSSLKSVDDIFTWNVFFTTTGIALLATCPPYILRRLSNNRKVKAL
ncbi:hypothetical protein RUM43_004181 [Polyplax serrata]|uniref:VTT domain-containing protein n=1 Tax=Polyplax serrata TaxID=468196 RepID=A0AAN8SBJ4_POLSC